MKYFIKLLAKLHQAIELLGYQVIDHGDVAIPLSHPKDRSTASHNQPRHLNLITESLKRIYNDAQKMNPAETFPLFLGGDHSIAIATAAAVAQTDNCGLVWIDAHADFNTHQTSINPNTVENSGLISSCL